MTAAAGPRLVAEARDPGAVPLWLHPEWAVQFDWLVQGTTGRGSANDGCGDWTLGLAGDAPVGPVLGRWRVLREHVGVPAAVHSRQVHGTKLYAHSGSAPPGMHVMYGFDGHLTDCPGLLLSVSGADCIPVSLVDSERRAVALLHAGWRGVAGGIVEGAIRRLGELYGTAPADLSAHFGPAICGACYEVGPEVHRAVNGASAVPAGPEPIDLRAAAAARAERCGVPHARITASAHCTRCGPGAFFSHRAGSPGRHMGVLGIRAPAE